VSLLLLFFVAILSPAIVASGGEAVEIVSEALEVHLERHPESEASDVYKFLHQAIYGPGHAIPDRSAAARYLSRELAGLGPPLTGELLCEELGGEPAQVRVNLRPFHVAGGDEDALLDAFVAAVSEVQGDRERMEKAIAQAITLLTAAGREDLATDLRSASEELASKGYPAIHHSERYREAYAPAYRVVTRKAAVEHHWCE